MLSYQHEYHCGNHADVLKHSILALTVRAMQRKDKPLRVIDAHAGSGSYDLGSAEAQRNAEFQTGISRVLAAPSPPLELEAYLAASSQALVAFCSGARASQSSRLRDTGLAGSSSISRSFSAKNLAKSMRCKCS